MLLDLLSLDNYVSYNIKVAEILGLHAAIYLSELMNINDKAIRKSKTKDNFFTVDRKYITPVVKFYDIWKDVLLNAYSKGNIKFQDGIQYIIFKNILKLDLNQ